MRGSLGQSASTHGRRAKTMNLGCSAFGQGFHPSDIPHPAKIGSPPPPKHSVHQPLQGRSRPSCVSVHASSSLVVAKKTRTSAIVVGGGIGGLVTAGRLAKAGMDVRLLEQGEVVGGRCQSVHMGPDASYRFDTGPSLLLFPQTYKKTYQALGTRIEDHVDMQRVEPAAYRVFFEGGADGPASMIRTKPVKPLRIDMFYDAQKMVGQLEDVEPGAGRQYLAWLADARASLDVGTKNFIERDFDGFADFLNLSRLLPLLGQVNIGELLGQHSERLAKRFKDPRLQALFMFQDLYVGLSPYNAPGVFSLLSATEITDGVWYPKGGFGTIRDSLREIAEGLGVRISTNAGVATINTSTDGKEVTGVTLKSGEVFDADIVVSNRDVPLSYGLLRGGAMEYGRKEEARISKLDYSAGVIAFNWCFNKRLHSLLHHNVFLSSEFRRSWNRATCPDTLAFSPNFYVHCPVRTDSSAAPPGCDSIMVLLPVANMQQMIASGECKSGDKGIYKSLVEEGRKAVLRTMKEAGVGKGRDLADCIISEKVIEPEEWKEWYGLQHGAAFGLSHGLDQLAVMRPPLRDDKVKGLYMVGASTRPGNGIPLVMIGADLCVGRVLQDVAAGKFATPR